MLIEDAGALCLSMSQVHYWSTVVHHYELITTVAASPAAAYSRPTLGVSCKLSKSNLSVCSILFTPAEFIHIFITGLGRGAEMPGDWRGCQQINWCLAILCYTGLQWHNVTDNVDIFILFKHTPFTTKLRIPSTSTYLTYLDTSSDMFCLIYCDLWSGHCNYRGDGIGSSSSINVSNIKQVERGWQQTSAGDFHFLFPKYLLLSSSYCSSHPLTYLCWGSH